MLPNPQQNKRRTTSRSICRAAFAKRRTSVYRPTCVWLCREYSGSVSNVDRQLSVAASRVLFGIGSGGQVVAVDGCLGCLAPYRRHSYLCTGVMSSSATLTSQHHSATYPPTPATLHAHGLTGVDARCLADFGNFRRAAVSPVLRDNVHKICACDSSSL